MKKILAALLAVMMMLTVVVVPTFAEANVTTFTGSTVSACPGEDVEFTINVSNNQGTSGVIITLNYDKNVFTQKEVKNGNVYPTAPTVGANLVWSESKNSDANGTLATVVFTVSEDAPIANYTIDVIVRQCSQVVGYTVANADFANENGAINVVEPVSEITGANIALEQNITVNYYAKLLETETAAKMQFTMNGTSIVVSGKKNKDGLYVYAFSGVAPNRMGDNIKAELVLGDKVLDTEETFSVKGYCIDILDSDAAALNITDDKYAALVVLVADLLEYGAAAQIYNEYKVDALVNDDARIGENKSEWSNISKAKGKVSITESALDGWGFTAATVYFYDANSLYVKVKADETAIVYNETADIEILLADCEYLEATGEYLVNVKDLAPDDYGTKFTIWLYDADYEEIQELKYSVAGYVYNIQNETTAMANLAKAVYTYALSAVAYAEA